VSKQVEMKSLFAVGASLAVLAGCGGSSPPSVLDGGAGPADHVPALTIVDGPPCGPRDNLERKPSLEGMPPPLEGHVVMSLPPLTKRAQGRAVDKLGALPSRTPVDPLEERCRYLAFGGGVQAGRKCGELDC
jgi:hypothetical protein